MIDSLARVDALATRCLTACGSGYMVWRLWGAGPPVVLLHGSSGSWTHWARNIMPLTRYFTVWAPDLPGFGDSDLPPGVETAEALADIVASGLDDVVTPPTPVDLLGFSFGGIIAGLVAARQGARIRTLVLLGAGGMALPAAPMPPLARPTDDMTLAETRALHRQNLEAVMFADGRNIDEAAIDAHAENVRRARFKSAAIPSSDALLRALPSVTARLVGIWGAGDAFVAGQLEPRRAILARHHPELDFRVIEGAGHWVSWEKAEVVNALLLELLGAGAPART